MGYDHRYRSSQLQQAISIALASLMLLPGGCSRKHYRLQADREAEHLVSERVEHEYRLSDRPVAPAFHSRLADLSDPDCGPLPPDDPAASRYMSRPYRSRGSKIWQKRGSLEAVEFDHWTKFLPQDDKGVLKLNRERSMELSLLHSREYQTAVENVYLAALPVSLQRFAFDTQWVGGIDLLARRQGNDFDTFSKRSSLGLRRQFASGGELLADFSNTMVWDFSGGNIRAGSVLSFQFLQPLMRGAFREIQLEPLTQAERNLLYTVRDFARFRQTFYINTIGNSGYLGLLEVAQAIRNQSANLDSLRRNLEEHEALAAAGQVSQFQVDQVYQEYEQGRLSLVTAQVAYAIQLDAFKLQMGLPPTQEAQLDDTDLQQFQLNNPELDELTAENEGWRIRLLQFDDTSPPSVDALTSAHSALAAIADELGPIAKEVREETDDWLKRLKEELAQLTEANGTADERSELERRQQLAERLDTILIELGNDARSTQEELDLAEKHIASKELVQALEVLGSVAGNSLRQLVADVFVVQTQVRVYLVDVTPVQLTDIRAGWLAEQYRLDLRNELGRVVDAYRQTEVAADLLESDLDLRLNADLRTDPNQKNLVRFDSSASDLSGGLEFDGPLNRMTERNIYRAAQINYQRVRRDYMAVRDGISFEVRNNLRILNRERFQFEITRQQLITAARQVEEAQIKLRSSTEPNSNLTRDLLTALQTLLRTRNGLIGSWVSYETSRMELYRSIGLLYVDDAGAWINDGDNFASLLDTSTDADSAISATEPPKS